VITRPLASGAGLPAFLEALQSGVDEALVGFAPDLVLLSLGCDALAGAPLGSLALSPADYHPLTTALRQRAEEICGGRLVTVLEEGYDAAATGRAVVQHLHALASLGTDPT
jgi:acetoin utilization deacetylase AcuC-like enzyme